MTSLSLYNCQESNYQSTSLLIISYMFVNTEHFLPILHHLFNISLYIGSIHEIWKTAKLIMIFKENKPKNDPWSYRPISLISCFGKILEKIITTRLYQLCKENNLINK